tara:strand:+ start:868 stop:1824 length:957 start_codon:yes stop_codon:yes gene_type:complete
MLAQAIIDASALKDAALKNAENAILEKYSSEIKDVVGTILEQEENKFTEDVPAAYENEELDAPALDEEIEIDFDQLKQKLEEEEAAGAEMDPADLTPSEEIADDILDTAPEAPEATEPEAAPAPDALDEEIEIDEEVLEALKVDIEPVKTGHLEQNDAFLEDSLEGAAAKEAQTVEDEDELTEAEEQNEELQNQLSKLQKTNEGLRDLLHLAKEQLLETNLTNAKLLYTNKVLNSASLNERQKNKIVDAISNVSSVEEAKVVYEALQNAVGTSNKVDAPQSLREALGKRTSSIIKSNRSEAIQIDPAVNRMQRLAGLK